MRGLRGSVIPRKLLLNLKTKVSDHRLLGNATQDAVQAPAESEARDHDCRTPVMVTAKSLSEQPVGDTAQALVEPGARGHYCRMSRIVTARSLDDPVAKGQCPQGAGQHEAFQALEETVPQEHVCRLVGRLTPYNSGRRTCNR